MKYDPSSATVRDTYTLMVQLIVPRPIAWVSSLSTDGIPNLAPFSYFNAVGSNPPCLSFCPANRRDGTYKDTLINVESTGEFVVNLVPHAMSEQMVCSAAEIPSSESEIEHCGLETVASDKVAPPRIVGAGVQFECTLLQSLHLGAGPGGANMVIGRIELIHVADELLTDEGRVDPRRLDTIARMGGKGYARTTDLFDMG